MTMVNYVVLVGRAATDAQLRYTPNGTPVTQFRLAVDRPGGSEGETLFIPVVCWRKLAETVGTYVRKGRLVAVEGSLQQRTYEQDGQKRTQYEILASRVSFLDRRKPVAAEASDEADSAPEPAPAPTPAATS